MPVTVIVGAQWGDEGNNKVADFLGGANGMLLDTDLGTYLFCPARVVPVLGCVA
jgi:adenylosuccinate synthase